MLRPRTFVFAVPVLLIVVLLGSYLAGLRRAVQRAHRTPCTLLKVEHPKLKVAPAQLVLTDLSGTRYPMSQLAGRLVVMNFWLTTCQPCLEELPSLLELAARYAERGMVLLLVSTDKKLKALKAFLNKMPRLKQLPASAVILRDPGGKIARQLGTTKYPETYLITPAGEWAGRVVGPRQWTGRAATTCLATRLP